MEINDIYFQSHRGGCDEMPENTIPAYLYSWNIKGAIPEVDVRTTRDDRLVCIHDDNLGRTTNAPQNIAARKISDLSMNEIKQFDAGISFNKLYKGETVPSLEDVFFEMKKDNTRQIYLDVKDVNLSKLVKVIEKFNLGDRIIFVHKCINQCKTISSLYKTARCMTWLEGSEQQIKTSFEEAVQKGFNGLKQIQIHLYAALKDKKISYHVNRDFLTMALAETKKNNVDLMVRPFLFDRESLSYLLTLGIKWFAVDEPGSFRKTLETMEAT